MNELVAYLKLPRGILAERVEAAIVPQILEALEIAISIGLELPLVYNSGGYDSVTTLRLLDGIVGIYMPDMKYADEAVARELSGANNYPQVNQAAVREMHRQVGNLSLDEEGIAIRGLLIHHLVLSNGLAGSSGIAAFIAGEVSRDSYVNIMDQYYPCHRAFSVPALGRRPRREELIEAVEAAHGAGLSRLDKAHPVVARFI